MPQLPARKKPLQAQRYIVGPAGSWTFPGQARSFVGDNDNAFLAFQKPDWTVHVACLSKANGLTEMALPGVAQYGASCLAYHNDHLYTLEMNCCQGPRGPFTFREFTLNPSRTVATPVPESTLELPESGDLGFGGDQETTQLGDMIRLRSGGFVVCWSSQDNDRRYVFTYRTPEGEWQENILNTDVFGERPSHMRLAQHPDGSILCFITRDSIRAVPIVRFDEIFAEGTSYLAFSALYEDVFAQEGEFTSITPVPHQNGFGNGLALCRQTDPYLGYSWGESASGLFRKGSAFGICHYINDATFRESDGSDFDRTPYVEELLYPQDKTRWSECIAPHAACGVDGFIYVYRQEWNVETQRFDLVVGTRFVDNEWDDSVRTVLYQCRPNDIFRGGAENQMCSFFNSSDNPNWNLFANVGPDGRLSIYEVRLAPRFNH